LVLRLVFAICLFVSEIHRYTCGILTSLQQKTATASIKDSLSKPTLLTMHKVCARCQQKPFDLVMGYHVLEHLPDFFGAMKAWLRSVKPGGLIIFALPSPCDQRWNHGESLRLVTDPSHFVEEYERPASTQRHSPEHMREAAFGIWGMQEESNPTLHPTPAILKRLGLCTRAMRASKLRLNFTTAYAIDTVRLPQIPLADIKCLVENLLTDDPHRAHLHVWSLGSLRIALALAERLMPSGLQFELMSAKVAARGAFSMEEFRVVLRRRRLPRAAALSW